MSLVKLNRINKGGEILVNSEHIAFIEVESKATTVHLTDGLLFSVEETPAEVARQMEDLAAARIANGIVRANLPRTHDQL
jgi:hypothetical protein